MGAFVETWPADMAWQMKMEISVIFLVQATQANHVEAFIQILFTFCRFAQVFSVTLLLFNCIFQQSFEFGSNQSRILI